eukprot:2418058-Pyramimonas_sp.AAC.1
MPLERLFGHSWSLLGASWGPPGGRWGAFGCFLGGLFGRLIASQAWLTLSEAVLGTSLGRLGAF